MAITPLTHHPLPKLYLPYGTLQHLPQVLGGPTGRWQRQQITVHWFVQHRSEPLAPYALLLQRFEGLPAKEQRVAQTILDEFFTEQEFRQLRAYLRKHYSDADLRTSILVPPISTLKPDASTQAGRGRPFGKDGIAAVSGATSSVLVADHCKESTLSPLCPDENMNAGFIQLTEAVGYDLSFSVRGYYALPRQAPRSAERSGAAIDCTGGS